jgi:hypothetical protein
MEERSDEVVQLLDDIHELSSDFRKRVLIAQMTARAPEKTPQIYIHYTVSEDHAGTQDE